MDTWGLQTYTDKTLILLHSLKLTDALQCERGAQMDELKRTKPRDAKKATAKEGIHGSTPFARLPYVNLQNIWMVPICHSLLYGVVKDFVSTFMEGK